MKASPRMKAVIEKLAKKHAVDLSQEGAHFRLDMPGFDRLCVENIGVGRISVAHYFVMNGDLVAEPDIEFLVDEKGAWLPLNITQSMTGFTRYAVFDSREELIVENERGQRQLADFANTWANNIEAQGWLENGVKYDYRT